MEPIKAKLMCVFCSSEQSGGGDLDLSVGPVKKRHLAATPRLNKPVPGPFPDLPEKSRCCYINGHHKQYDPSRYNV